MSDNFGLKIGVEGEKQFKQSLADINRAFKVLGSEMQLVTSQFDKNDRSAASLTSRNEVLNKEIDQQKEKITTLRAALENAASSFGENDRRTQNWQIALNKAEAELNGMERELGANEKALDGMGKEEDDAAKSADNLGDELKDTGNEAEKSGGKFEKLGGILKGIGTAMGAVAVAAGAAAVKLGKEVIAAYADYEQLVGGVDTLFGDASQTVQTFAENAFKTAGMSANDYMETVTSFSASLISSLGGDTEKAVEYADMAITDMSDNANKMGTDMASIQNAYQGFAKQNYTMLDNLKLGYGGTKQEMERLLADAQAISGVEYNIDSYADVVEAIHVIQTSMDITGTTAREAEHTISGSINSMQAAIQNLVVGFGNADADMEQLCNNVVDAFKDVVANVTPIIENIVSALPTATGALLEAIAELLPTLLQTVTELFSQVLTTLLNLLPSLIPAAVEAVMTIVNAIIENLPLLIEAAVQLIATLVQGIGEALPTLIPAAVQAIVTIVQGLIENLPMILDAALQLIMGLAQGLLDAIPILVAALPDIITAIVEFIIGAIPQIIDAGIQLLTSLITALPEIISAIVAAIPQIQRVVDTRSLVTRLYAVGADGLTFADINGGKPYVEDFSYTNEIRISTLDCSSFTNPYQMKEYTEMRLAQYAKPTISYVLNAMDLSVLTGYEHEAWELGDYVRVEDKELGISVTTRIVRREYNLQEPWNTVLELSTTLKNLGSSASQWDNAADTLEGTSMVSNDDIREMVPFNLLRNSRADDGLAYWTSSGFVADGENGASGTASFMAEGVSGRTKSLSQTVYPANRDSYTISAQIGSEDLEKLSDSSQVGIEVIIEYEDGSTESRFIDLY